MITWTEAVLTKSPFNASNRPHIGMRVLLGDKEGRVKESNCGRVIVEIGGQERHCYDAELRIAPSILSQLGEYKTSDAVRGLQAVCFSAIEEEIRVTSKSAVAKKIKLTPKKLADILKQKTVPFGLCRRVEEMSWRVTVGAVENWLIDNGIKHEEIREVVVPTLTTAEAEAQRRYIEAMQTDCDRRYY